MTARVYDLRAGEVPPVLTGAPRVLVCGSRRFDDAELMRQAIAALPAQSSIVHGGACGADWWAGYFARQLGLAELVYAVDHRVDGPWPEAGPRRNRRMIRAHDDYAECYAFPVDVPHYDRRKAENRGTRDCVRQALAAGIDVVVWRRALAGLQWSPIPRDREETRPSGP